MTKKSLTNSVKELIKAWENLEGNKKYTPKEIENWLVNDMKPAIDNLRAEMKAKK